MSGGMITIKGVTELKGYFEAQRTNQLPYALSVGLNDVAFEIRAKEIGQIGEVFDRPKPQTAKNVFVQKATKASPRAVIRFDQIYNKGGDEYMEAEVSGGNRLMKPSEQRLGRFFVPGKGAKMDKYGNMQGSQITQILSRLGRFGDVGSYQINQRLASKVLSAESRKNLVYFMVTEPHGGLQPGIYQRVKWGAGFDAKTAKSLPAGSWQKGRTKGRVSSVIQGRGVIPIVLFVDKAPTYKARWHYVKAAQAVADEKLGPYLGRAIEMALKTAR